MERTNPAASADLRLAGAFREDLPPRGTPSIPPRDGDPAPADAALGASLRGLFEEGRRAWPGVDLAPEVFVRHLAARAYNAAAGQLPPAARAPDLYLACACATRVRGAIEAFDQAHLGLVGVYLARMRPAAAFVDDVRQSLREKLFVGKENSPAKIGEYDGRGALASWVRVVALRAAIDLRRRAADAVAEADREQPDAATSDPELGYVKARYREAFNAAFRGAVASLSGEPRELLRLHFVDGLTLDQLAARAGVHRATIARRIAAARDAVADEARRRLGAALGANEAELASLAGVMRSQIDLSLPGLLRPS